VPAATGTFDLSAQQEELWLAEPGGPTARLQAVVALDGELEPGRLRAALAGVAARHDILRTTFHARPGASVPVQVIHDTLEPAWEQVELDADAQQTQIEVVRIAELTAPIDMERGPLLRARLMRLGERRHALVLTASALIADVSSMRIAVRDLAQEYAGREPVVAEPLQYADFAAWQRDLESSDDDEAHAAAEFWSAASRRPRPPLPLSRPAAGAFVATEIELDVPDDLAATIAERARGYGTTPQAFVHAAWLVLLSRLGIDDAVAGYVGHERRQRDLAGAIGPFARAVPVCSAGRETFGETLSDIARARAKARTWQDHAPANRAPAPLVGYVDDEWDEHDAGEVRIATERLTATGLPFRAWVTCARAGTRLRASLSFDPAYLDDASAHRLARGLELLLADAAADPGADLAALRILDPAEREEMLQGFSGPEWDVGPASVHERIAEWARRRPHQVAVIDGDDGVSYRELEGRADLVASRLRALGVGPDTCVGLLCDGTVAMVVGIVGILRSGSAYVPLHPQQPPARLRALLESCGAAALVAPAGLAELAGGLGVPVLAVEQRAVAVAGEARGAPAAAVSPEHLAYVINTSGCSGAPNGVMVTHGNLANYVADMTARIGAADPQTFALVTAASTNLANTALFGALCSGGTLLLVDAQTATNAEAFARLAERTPIDVLTITPSHLRELIAASDARVLPQRRLVLGGEPVAWDLIAEVRALGDCAILNHYGPAEATVGSCTLPVPADPGPFAPRSVPIGSPIANTRCYVLDERREPVPIGARGTLFISGAGVARGYIGAKALTAERFHVDPFVDGARMYDTGDLVRRLPDGTLELLGRADEQVAIRGHGGAPGEVEATPAAREGEALLETQALLEQLLHDARASRWQPPKA
jgi:amino acid adenylation domain-containing protein